MIENEGKQASAAGKLPQTCAGSEIRVLDPTRHGENTQELETYLRSRIVSQEAAVEAVIEMYQMFQVGLNPPDRPVGNLLFLGPTGSGKTYVVEVLAEALFGSSHAFTKVDCAEFQQPHEIAKLIGSPPGYVGHRETPPMLSQKSLDQWQTEGLKLSLVLFDEIEKASDALWQLLLGVLDKATITLGDNQRVDLGHCLVFMTSNVGASDMSELAQGGIGFVSGPKTVDASFDDKINRAALEAARRKFSPEFINRIDKMVVFKTLRPEQLEQVLELELGKVQQRITAAAGNKPFEFRCTPQVKEWLLKQGTDVRYGARHLKRVIERHIVYSLANLVATGQVETGDSVEISMAGEDSLSFSKKQTTINRISAAGGGI